ncbi:MAG: calcium/proton exchanger [Myxococcales bacterium]|nr:calcium/proton exchanger [Myxococcales bacterium]
MKIWRSLPLPKYLLVFAPAALIMHFGHYAGPVTQFIVAAVAILGLVVVIGAATEEVAMRVGDVWGGLLNATFGNVTELIIALLALKKGSYKVVRASLTGSILGNLLLLLGLSMFAGGVRHKTQTFSRTGAAASVQMLALCLFALVIPTVADKVFYGGVHGNVQHDRLVEHLSLAVAILLLVAYGLNLVFSLWTHSFTFRSTDAAHSEEPQWSFKAAIIVLLGTVVVVALCSDVFVAALDDMIKVAKVPISEMFLGVVVVAIVGNAAEGSVAVIAATKNKMELAFQVAMSSALQIALMVSPVLVIVSAIISPNNPMTLAFSAFELLGLWAGVLISAFALNDGESNWFEGALMVIVYIAFAIVFWFHP